MRLDKLLAISCCRLNAADGGKEEYVAFPFLDTEQVFCEEVVTCSGLWFSNL
jgi:hypothetical protein